MLAGKGFESVFNISGGFKAWKNERAIGTEELGINLFTGDESPEFALVVAYSLEAGLQDFYVDMMTKVKKEAAKNLFGKLSKIEQKHQERILKEYQILTGDTITQDEFEKSKIMEVVEGGMTTKEYAELFRPDWESVDDIVGIAMSIEAQALDLYLRAAAKCTSDESKNALLKIAEEERMHLTQLGKLMAS